MISVLVPSLLTTRNHSSSTAVFAHHKILFVDVLFMIMRDILQRLSAFCINLLEKWLNSNIWMQTRSVLETFYISLCYIDIWNAINTMLQLACILLTSKGNKILSNEDYNSKCIVQSTIIGSLVIPMAQIIPPKL